jgi:hypothetical protein
MLKTPFRRMWACFVLVLVLGASLLGIVTEVQQQSRNHALLQAIRDNNAQVVIDLLGHGADPNTIQSSEAPWPSFLWKWLLPKPRKPVSTDSDTKLPVLMLAFAAWWKPEGGSDEPPQNTEIIEALLRAGANIHVRDAEGITPLLQAALSHRTALVKRLLNLGAEINAVDAYGRTTRSYMNPDGYQNVLSHREIYQLLLKAGVKE